MSIAARLEERIEEQQRMIDNLSRRFDILNQVFDDLKNVEQEHESHTLLAKMTVEEGCDDEELGMRRSKGSCCC